MTDLLARSTDSGPAASGKERRRAPATLLAVGGAVWAAGLGLLTCGLFVLVGWAAAPHSGSSPDEALRTAGLVWLVAHHASLHLPQGQQLGFSPLGLMLLALLPLYGAGRWVSRSGEVRRRADALPAIAVISVVYALLALIVAGASTGAARPDAVSSLLGPFLVALVGSGAGVLRGSGLVAALSARLPGSVTPVLVAGVTGTAALLAGGALLGAVALLAHLGRAVELTAAYDTGAVGGVLLLLLGAAIVPNLSIWAAAYCVGPGFAIGAGTSVSPAGIELGDVPSLPLLAALPGSGVAPAAALPAMLIPLIAGALAGVVVARRHLGASAERAALDGLAAGAVGGLLMGLLAALSGGPAGAGRLTAVGPSPWQVGVAAALELAISASAAAWWTRHRSARG